MGVHIIGQAGVQHVAAVDGPDVGPPVDAHGNARQHQPPQLPPVPQHGPDGAEAPPRRQDGGDEHQGPHDASGQHIQGIHSRQHLPEYRQDTPQDITDQDINRTFFHGDTTFPRSAAAQPGNDLQILSYFTSKSAAFQ